MRTKDIVVGLIVLGVLVGGVLWFRKARIEKQRQMVVETPSVEEQIKKTFNGLEIPEDVEKAELKDVSGGDGVGIAPRDTVLADLPDLKSNETYEVWVERNGKQVMLGKMRIAKGGFLYEGKIDGEKILVKLGGKTVLEGSF